MMCHLYMTDYGPVQVSEREAFLLGIRDEAVRYGLLIQNERVERRIAALEAACERTARWKLEGVAG